MTVYQYDINSAYAYTYQSLPCMLHGKWVKAKGIPRDGIYFAEVTFKHPGRLTVGTLPVRDKKGSILFPMEGRGIYWFPELDVARKYGVKFDVVQCFRYRGHCDCRNFDFINRMYEKRKELGKDDKGMVLKLALASTYGKLVQSVGTAPYANPVYGGIITSSVRASLVDAALSLGNGGSDVIMLATDGMFCKLPRPDLKIGTELGEWSVTEYDSMFVVQSGVYFLPGKKPKTRGVPQSKVIEHEEDFRDAWQHFLDTGETATVEIGLVNFVGVRLALARNKLNTAGQWQKVTKTIRFDFTGKRSMPTVTGTSVKTEMVPGSPSLSSVPYPRMIGGHRAKEAYAAHIDPTVLEAYELSEKERLEYADQPDWGDTI